MPRRIARPGATLLVAVTLAVTVAGATTACSKGHGKQRSAGPSATASPGAVPAPASGSGQAPASTGGSGKAPAQGGASGSHGPVTVAPMPSYAMKTVASGTFNTPSHITCAMSSTEVSCQVTDPAWPLPSPQPAGCSGKQYAGRVTLSLTGAAQPVCQAGSIVGSGTETLEYGKAMRVDPFECFSSQSNVLCRNVRTARGFTLAQAAYAAF